MFERCEPNDVASPADRCQRRVQPGGGHQEIQSITPQSCASRAWIRFRSSDLVRVDYRQGARFEREAFDAIPASLRNRVKRSRWSRRRIDQFARLPLDVPTRVLAGGADLAYSPDFTLPGAFGGKGMITVHDVAFELIPDAYPPGLLSYLRTVVPHNVRRADVVAVVSRTTRIDVVERYNVSADRVVVVPNAADDRFFDAQPLSTERRRQLGVPDDYLLTVGTIEPRKTIGRFLRLSSTRSREQDGRWSSSDVPAGVIGMKNENARRVGGHRSGHCAARRRRTRICRACTAGLALSSMSRCMRDSVCLCSRPWHRARL